MRIVGSWRRWLVVCVVAGLVAACGSGGGSGSPSSTSGPGGSADPVTGGSFRYVGWLDLARTWDPTALQARFALDGDKAFAVFDSLFLAQSTGEVVPQTAESATPNDDATVWTVKLRPGITFTDGTPYDAEAVKYNWERHADPDLGSVAAAYAAMMDEIRVVDALTLEVTLGQPYAHFPVLLTTNLGYIGSPTALEADAEGFGQKPVGAGPFTMAEWRAGESIRFEKNPDYWNAPLPYVDEVVYTIVADDGARLNTILSGGADAAGTVSAGMATQAAKDGTVTVNTTKVGGGGEVFFNMAKAPFDDVRARRALQVGLDFERFAEELYGGVVSPATSVFGEASPFYDDGLTFPDHDPEEAQELFDALAAEQGGVFEFTMLVAASLAPDMEYFQSQLLGTYENVNMEIEVVDSLLDYRTRVVEGDFQAASFAVFMVHPLPNVIARYRSDGAENFQKYANPAVDAALNEFVTSTDQATQDAALDTVQEHLITDSAAVYFRASTTWTMYRPGAVAGFEQYGDGMTRFDKVQLTP